MPGTGSSCGCKGFFGPLNTSDEKDAQKNPLEPVNQRKGCHWASLEDQEVHEMGDSESCLKEPVLALSDHPHPALASSQ